MAAEAQGRQREGQGGRHKLVDPHVLVWGVGVPLRLKRPEAFEVAKSKAGGKVLFIP